MKKIISILLSVIMIFSLCACGNGNSDVEESSKESTTESTSQPTEDTTEKHGEDTTESTEEDTTVEEETSEKVPKAKKLSKGKKIVVNNFEFTLKKVELSYDVKPSNPPKYYSHYPADDGQVYIYINAKVKNLNKQKVSCDEIYSVVADYNDGYTYTGFNIVTDTDGDFTYANITSIDPLQTLEINYLIDCPEEVETSNKPLLLTFNFGDDQEYTYKVR